MTPKLQALFDFINEAKQKEIGPFFLGLPDRWYEKPGPKYRCENGHISTCILKSEERGGDCCLECMAFVKMTFPEDVENEI